MLQRFGCKTFKCTVGQALIMQTFERNMIHARQLDWTERNMTHGANLVCLIE